MTQKPLACARARAASSSNSNRKKKKKLSVDRTCFVCLLLLERVPCSSAGSNRACVSVGCVCVCVCVEQAERADANQLPPAKNQPFHAACVHGGRSASVLVSFCEAWLICNGAAGGTGGTSGATF